MNTFYILTLTFFLPQQSMAAVSSTSLFQTTWSTPYNMGNPGPALNNSPLFNSSDLLEP